MENRGENPIFIFDLDGTTVDSRHRTTMPFNLAYWNENATRENILKDALMQLSKKMVELIGFGYEVVICTARTLSKYDYEYLYDIIGLPNDIKIISRAKEDTRENHIYKKSNLQYLVNLGESIAKTFLCTPIFPFTLRKIHAPPTPVCGPPILPGGGGGSDLTSSRACSGSSCSIFLN